jgi:hypothetical protein
MVYYFPVVTAVFWASGGLEQKRLKTLLPSDIQFDL